MVRHQFNIGTCTSVTNSIEYLIDLCGNVFHDYIIVKNEKNILLTFYMKYSQPPTICSLVDCCVD